VIFGVRFGGFSITEITDFTEECFGQRDVEHAEFERSRAQKLGVFAWAKSKGIFRQDSQDLQDYQD